MKKLISENKSVQISVIVPVYNVEPYISVCVNSILNQSFADFELILIDDGSTDNSGKICDRFAEKDARIKVIHQENGGLSLARNTGIDKANGQYLAFIDSDDWVHPNFLEVLYRLCEDNTCQIAQCGFQKLFNEADTVPVHRCDACILTGKDMVHKLFAANGWFNVVTWNKLYHKNLFKTMRFPIGMQHEDEFITYKAFWQSGRIAYTTISLYYYRQREGSIMSQGFTKKSLDAIVAHEERVNFFKNLDENLYRKSLNAFIATINRCLCNLCGHDICVAQEKLEAELEEKYLFYKKCLDEISVKNVTSVLDDTTFKPAVCSYKLKYDKGVEVFHCSVSVVVPVYNAEKWLAECIDSILKQTLADTEIVIVNDNSTDASKEIIEAYKNQDVRIMAIEQPYMGAAAARSKGLLMAHGKYVCFMDADDFYPEADTLEKLYKKAKAANVLAAGSSLSYYREGIVNIAAIDDNKKYLFYRAAKNKSVASKLSNKEIQELLNIKNGYSFKIGRIITFIPRKIVGGIRCYNEHGLKFTIMRLKEKIFGG